MREDSGPPLASRSWIRTVYLYLLAFLGLVLLASGGVQLLDMGLKATVFRAAEQEERLSWMMPPMPPVDRARGLADSGASALTAEERALVRQWVQEYEQWKLQRERMDPVASRRQRDASTSLALILVGLPLYLYHWSLIRREARERAA